MTALLASGIGIPGRLQPTDVQLNAGQLTAVIGPNGGGKTSLLRAAAGVEPGASGEVWVDDEALEDVPPIRRAGLLGFLPAARDVPWSISARDVIALGLPRPDRERVAELIEMLELERLAERPVNQLSTGERARVLLARVLAPRPRVLLLDEPCSNLDPYWAHRIMDVLRSAATEGAAIALSIHDLGLLTLFDRVLLVEQGRIRLDTDPAGVLASSEMRAAFWVEPQGSGWRIIPPEDRQSLR